jgi:photosystem II stability/assembly factor-like uncharacterized protein
MARFISVVMVLATLMITTSSRGQWQATSFPYSNSQALIPFGQFVFSVSGGSVSRSSDDGETWAEAQTGIPSGSDLYRMTAYRGDLIITTGFAGIYKSSDTGKTWRLCLGKGNPDNGGASIISMGDTLFMKSGQGLLRSYDEGDHWQQIPRLYGDTGIWCFHRAGSLLFAGTDRGGVFRSSDRGESWEGLTPWLKDTNVNAIETHGSYIFAATRYAGIYRSSDLGVHWQRVNNGFSKVDVRGLLFVGDTLFAGFNHAGGVMMTTDLGDSWHDVSQGLTDLDAFVFCVKDGYLFEGGGGLSGVWRRPLSEFSDVRPVGANQLQADELQLEQNFPNPFNPTTVIGYLLAHSGDVRFVVVDILGREKIVQSEHKISGHHTMTVDGSKLASGVYTYSIESGGLRLSRTMIVEK